MVFSILTLPQAPKPWCGELWGGFVGLSHNGSGIPGPNCVGNFYHESDLVKAHNTDLVLHAIPFQIAEGFFILSILLAVFVTFKLRRLTFAPRFPRVALGLMLIGLAGFAFLCAIDILPQLFALEVSLYPFFSFITIRLPTGEPFQAGEGVLGVAFLGVAVIAYSLRTGSLSRGVLEVGFPATLALMIAVFIVLKDQMILQVINYLTWVQLDGIQLVSNWTMLVVSGGITIWAVSKNKAVSTRIPGRRAM